MIKILKNWADKLNLVRQPWWIEILTSQPKCTYYFGPFINANEANLAIVGYVEDLESESAQGIETIVKRCNPTQLTIEDDI